MAKKKKSPGKHYRSAVTGRTVSKKFSEENPATTYGSKTKKK